MCTRVPSSFNVGYHPPVDMALLGAPACAAVIEVQRKVPCLIIAFTVTTLHIVSDPGDRLLARVATLIIAPG